MKRHLLNESGFLLVCDNVEDMLQAQVVNVLVSQRVNRFDILQNIDAHSLRRDHLMLSIYPIHFVKCWDQYAPI